MLKNDIWIAHMAQKGMISPFEPNLVRELQGDRALPLRPAISYGLSSYGYDIRYALLNIDSKQQQQEIFALLCKDMLIQHKTFYNKLSVFSRNKKRRSSRTWDDC